MQNFELLLHRLTDSGVGLVIIGGFERLHQQAEDFEIGSRTYQIIPLDDLITNKEAVGREKDLLAVKELRAIAARRPGKP